MGRISDLFAGRSLEAVLRRARAQLGAGDFEEATRVVELGLERFPEAEALRELSLTLRRVKARSKVQDLKLRLSQGGDPVVYERLISTYHDMELPQDAREAAQAYALAHPGRDTPHLLLGEMYLQSFFEDLQARDGHRASEHLLRAARLNAQAIKPRLLLAELYFCIGAHKALHVVGRALERIDPDDDTILPVLEAISAVPNSSKEESLEGLLAHVEADGRLLREPTMWPLRTRRNREAQVLEARTHKTAAALVRKGVADEIVVLRRNGTPLSHAEMVRGDDDDADRGKVVVHDTSEEEAQAAGLGVVARTISNTVSKQARDLDLGAFKRCSIQGPFGLVVVGSVSNVVAAARRRTGAGEPLHLWERVSVALDGVSRGGER